MSALDYEPVWEKSRVFIRRAIGARDTGDFAEFCFWSAVSLELLGKAMLARIHPALIAEPTHPESLFVACGKPMTASPRTIIAKTVFTRIQALSKDFDQTDFNFCTLMMERRNAELHSGDLPYHGLLADTWAPRFWRVTVLVLAVGSRTLEDWIGADEANRAQALIGEAATVRQQSVESRIERSRAEFNGNYDTDEKKDQIRQLSKGGRLTPTGNFGPLTGDSISVETCPACSSNGRLSCEKTGEDEPDPEDFAWESGFVLVTVRYAPLAFRCGVCNLKLDGQEELGFVGMADEFESEEEQEIEYDDDIYQNE